MALKEKIVKKFETKEEAEDFIANKWGSTGLLFTWAPITGSQYNDKPPTRINLTLEEEEIKLKLMNSITEETKNEYLYNELSRHVRNSYKLHHKAKGYKDTK